MLYMLLFAKVAQKIGHKEALVTNRFVVENKRYIPKLLKKMYVKHNQGIECITADYHYSSTHQWEQDRLLNNS